MNLVSEMTSYKERSKCKTFFENYTNAPFSDNSFLIVEDGTNLSRHHQYGHFCILLSHCEEKEKIYRVNEPIHFEVNELNLVNCVFFNDVIIKVSGDNASISLAQCFCFGHVRIDGCSNKSYLGVTASLIDELEICGSFDKVQLFNDSLGFLIFYRFEVPSLNVEFCSTEKIRIDLETRVQLSLKEMFKVNMEKTFLFDDNKGEWKKYPMLGLYGNNRRIADKDAEITCAEDMAEFIEKNRLYTTANEYAQFLYMKNKISLTGISKFVYICFGGMVKPWIIVIWLLGIIFVCGLLYLIFGSLSCFSNEISLSKKLFQAMYFSAVTVTSIGYGDIQPHGIAKIIAALEGLAGLLIGGVFCIALTRKYFSR